MSSYKLPSLYIPFVFTQTTDEKIINVIEFAYGLGKVAYIDRITREDANGSYHNSIYIHFETFNFNERTERFLEHAKNKNDPPRLYYEYGKPWFWKAMINTQIGKEDYPGARAHHQLSSIERPKFQNPQYEEALVIPVSPSLSLPVAPSLSLPVAPALTNVFPTFNAPEQLPAIKLPENCDGWYDNVSDLSERFVTPTTPREKTLKIAQLKFVPRVLALRKSENIVNDCLCSTVILNQRTISKMETQYEYQEGESILLSRLMEIVSSKRQEQRIATDDGDDEYEGSSEEATTQSECSDNSTKFEGSSNSANIQYIQSVLA